MTAITWNGFNASFGEFAHASLHSGFCYFAAQPGLQQMQAAENLMLSESGP